MINAILANLSEVYDVELVYGDIPSAGNATGTATTAFYPFVTNGGLYFNAIINGESQDEILYEQFPTGSTYNFRFSATQPVTASDTVIIPDFLNNLVLGGPFPTINPRIVIDSTPEFPFDDFRGNGISPGLSTSRLQLHTSSCTLWGCAATFHFCLEV